jgi:Flp pilus assembly CpaE family ATPase
MTNAMQSKPVAADEHIAPAPRVSVQAFCETVETAAAIQAAGEDRRLAKAHLKVQMGGIAAAVEAYGNAPTSNVIIIESESRGADLLEGLDSLAEVCDAGTHVLVIGRYNDVLLYRDMVRRGISDYLISPVGVIEVVRAICGLFSAPDAKPVGRVIAVIGAKGGVGASTIAHNIAWAIARDLRLDTVVGDLDLGFGTAGLDFNQDPPQGIADAVFSPDRIDTAFIDRLLSNYAFYLDAKGHADTSDPLVRQEIARLETGYRLGRLLVLRETLKQAPPSFSAATKTFCTEHEQRVAEFAARAVGPDAMVWGRLARGVCYAPAYTIMGGTSNVLRNIIGERVLGLPREPS